MAGRGAEAEHAPLGADIDEHVAGFEMGVEESAGGIFETAVPRLALDQMLDRQVGEKVFRDRQGKARLALGIAKNGRQQEGAVGRGIQT